MIFASDLDRTLIYSRQAFLIEPNEVLDLQLIETLDGNEISFMTKQAILNLKNLAEEITFIPVTTRTTEQFNRITIFPSEVHHDYAVTSNGANVLKDGELDQDWANYIHRKLKHDALSIPEVLKAFEEIYHDQWVLRTKTAEEFFIYNIIDINHVPTDELLQFEMWLHRQNWQLSQQGRKLYFVPSAVNKADAVKYIQEITGKKTIIAAGDSKLDLPLLKVADHAICPQHGELYQTLDPSKMIITEAKGIKASEEILEHVLRIQRINS